MSWSTKQSSAIAFLNSLEQFGMERNLPLRVLDSIRELREDTENADEQSLEQILLEVEPLLKHMRKKYQESGETEIVPMQGMADTVSMEDVTDRIKEIIDNGLADARERSRICSNEQSQTVLELERGLREIQHTRAHYKEIGNAGRFQSFCNQVETKYNTRLSHSMSTYADALCQDCDQMLTKIRAILTKIKDQKVHVSQREFWVAYDNRGDLIKRRIQSTAAKIAGEQKAIDRWAATLLPKLDKSKKKLFWKRLLGILAPWLGVLVLALASSVISGIGQKEEAPIEITVSDNETATEITNQVISEGMEIIMNKILGGDGGGGNPVLDMLLGLSKLVWVLILVLYVALYIPFILKKCKNGFCDEVAGYLTPEMEKFLQEADFAGTIVQNCESIRADAEQACQEILTMVLDKTEIPEAMQVRSEGEEFAALCNRWESIRKTV